jgi:hypothetical protein
VRSPATPALMRIGVATVAFVSVLGLSMPMQSADGAETGSLPLRPVADVRLPGTTSRFDYQAIDAQRRVLFISHLGDNEVVAVGLGGPQVLGAIHGVQGATGLGVVTIPPLAGLIRPGSGGGSGYWIPTSSWSACWAA